MYIIVFHMIKGSFPLIFKWEFSSCGPCANNLPFWCSVHQWTAGTVKITNNTNLTTTTINRVWHVTNFLSRFESTFCWTFSLITNRSERHLIWIQLNKILKRCKLEMHPNENSGPKLKTLDVLGWTPELKRLNLTQLSINSNQLCWF